MGGDEGELILSEYFHRDTSQYNKIMKTLFKFRWFAPCQTFLYTIENLPSVV